MTILLLNNPSSCYWGWHSKVISLNSLYCALFKSVEFPWKYSSIQKIKSWNCCLILMSLSKLAFSKKYQEEEDIDNTYKRRGTGKKSPFYISPHWPTGHPNLTDKCLKKLIILTKQTKKQKKLWALYILWAHRKVKCFAFWPQVQRGK